MKKINVSIVLYQNQLDQLIKAIDSILNTNLNIKLYLIDNSANDDLKILAEHNDRMVYIFNNANLGYGAGHNIAIQKSIQDSIPYHLVLNPDIYFESDVLSKLHDYMEEHQNVGNIIPQVKYPDGEIQHLCKLLPTPMDLILRRFIPLKEWKDKRNEQYELKWTGYNKIMNIPSLSGCFMFLRVDALKKVGLFDENIFMYLEDTDLNRRLHREYKTIFYPEVEIFHEYGKESYKNKKLLKYHIQSAIYYFNKYGWLFDKEREKINKATIENLKSHL